VAGDVVAGGAVEVAARGGRRAPWRSSIRVGVDVHPAHLERLDAGGDQEGGEVGQVAAIGRPGRARAWTQAIRKVRDADGLLAACATMMAVAQAERTGEGDSEEERSWREAVAAGDLSAWSGLGRLLAGQAGREEEAEAACREAIDAGNSAAWNDLGRLLAEQPGREVEAEAAFREAIAAGDGYASNSLGLLLAAQPGREAEAERAFREAIASGDTDASYGLGWLLARQGGREDEAEAAFREAIAAGNSEALGNLGLLLAGP